MGDLFNLVELPSGYNKTQFWGDYEFLNSAGNKLTEKVCLTYQLSKLRKLENSSSTAKQLNNFIEKLETVKEVKIQDKTVQMTENQIYQRILEIVNAGFFGNSLNPRRQKMENENLDIQLTIQNLIKELQSLLKVIEYSGDPNLTDIVERQLQGKKFIPFSDNTVSSYVQYKADLAEKLLAHALTQNLSGGVQAGQLYSQGQQLIQDAFSLPMDLVFDSPFSVHWAEKGSNNKEQSFFNNFNDLFNFIDKLSGNYSVFLSDELTELIEKYKILAGQAKSGYRLQSLLNKNKRNSISLGEAGPTASLIALDKLYKTNWINPTKNSESLSMIANYCLSKSIGKIMLVKNDIYFTRDGFITAAGWMQKYQKMLKFLPSVNKVSDNFLGVPRTYNFSISPNDL